MNDFVTPEWLRSHGAFENQNELVITGVSLGFQCQFRFGFALFNSDRIERWCLVPSTGDGRFWLPTQTTADQRQRGVSIGHFYAVALILGITIASGN